MKRKRVDDEIVQATTRPFQKRDELMNVCLQLNLKYNTEMNLEATDLSIYRYAETIDTLDMLKSFVAKLKQSIIDREELIFMRE
ncbi:MAG: hypothetical protein CMO44_13315 [Verrucomicrobiales bacterium]|nr:hypothetical protein [Verrucomicrobiales bacterium]|tara:strand:- start:11979 stop:12230 length:252 start_codon:yes stop_codon:yes gene_type:complete